MRIAVVTMEKCMTKRDLCFGGLGFIFCIWFFLKLLNSRGRSQWPIMSYQTTCLRWELAP